MTLRRAHIALSLSLLFLSSTARAQLRYVASLDAREVYNSNVFAGVDSQDPNIAPWDMVTELEPSLRLYWGLPRGQLYLRYNLLFQIYTNHEDQGGTPQDTSDDSLLYGYANNLLLGYNHTITRERTEVAISNRFSQGTENTQIQTPIGANGVRSNYFTSGSKFINNALMAGIYHAITPIWNIQPRVQFELFRVFDWELPDTVMPPPYTYAVNASNTLQRLFPIGDLRLVTEFTYLLEDRGYEAMDDFQGIYPDQMNTYLAAVILGWHHVLSEQWDYRLGAGVDVRILEELEYTGGDSAAAVPPEVRTTGDYEPGWGPIGEASLRFRWQHWASVTLGYMHRTQVLLERGLDTTAETDEVGLGGFVILPPFRVDVDGSFRYIRGTSRFLDREDEDGSKLWRARATVTYAFLPWLSVEAGYDLELVTDYVAGYRLDQNRDEFITRPVEDYDRHLVFLGLSLVWPPPPEQDRQLNRRASEYEPTFTIGGGGGDEQQRQQTELDNPDRLEGQGQGSEDPLRLDPDQRQ